MNQYEIVVQLTKQTLPDDVRIRMLNEFASDLGWKPSDWLDLPNLKDVANAHLVVEHGLESAAVISFLRYPRKFSNLGFREKERLLTISYNNLVDWHIQVEIDEVIFVFIRSTVPQVIEKYPISRDNVDSLRSQTFEKVIGRRPNPNIPALDEALIQTISFWKRNLSAEMEYKVTNENLSALFNSIIFTRAIEDHYKRLNDDSSQALLSTWNRSNSDNSTLRTVLRETILQFTNEIPEYLFSDEKMEVFDNLHRQTVSVLLSDFYKNKYAPYEYDFSLMSKHALSRIYEHYASILTIERSQQLTLFPRLPEEERNKVYGSIYTPQFIARFFAKYLRDQTPPFAFRRIRTSDPASGSGIFLRTVLELQCDPLSNEITRDLIHSAFENVFGLDVDENACQATKLSLALLHLILTDSFPKNLNIYSAETIQYFQEHPDLKGSFDAVIANPPFVSLDSQSQPLRDRVSDFMAEHASGRIDLYLAFLYIGLQMVRPGGFGMFVLPHSFLIGKNAAGMRNLLSNSSWIRCLADLSAIRVFGETGSYIILLIFQKKPTFNVKAPPATIVKCQDLVGLALQDVLEGREAETNFYSIYNVEQEAFGDKEWYLLPPTEARIQKKLASLPVLGDFLQIRLGFISGADDIFIIESEEIPEGEGEIYVPYLPDREMELYTVPETTSQYFFYPYADSNRLGEEELREKYPKTWSYLLANQEALRLRSSVKKGNINWWEPVRPRPPQRMMRPKIITPHLVVVPRFSLDIEGVFAVSHSPLLYPKQEGAEEDLLRFFVAVLNSSPCFWYIATHSHKYRHGYIMLEPKTLKLTPIPDPTMVSPTNLLRLINLTDKRVLSSGSESLEIEKEIEKLVSELYGLSREELRAIGMEG